MIEYVVCLFKPNIYQYDDAQTNFFHFLSGNDLEIICHKKVVITHSQFDNLFLHTISEYRSFICDHELDLYLIGGSHSYDLLHSFKKELRLKYKCSSFKNLLHVTDEGNDYINFVKTFFGVESYKKYFNNCNFFYRYSEGNAIPQGIKYFASIGRGCSEEEYILARNLYDTENCIGVTLEISSLLVDNRRASLIIFSNTEFIVPYFLIDLIKEINTFDELVFCCKKNSLSILIKDIEYSQDELNAYSKLILRNKVNVGNSEHEIEEFISGLLTVSDIGVVKGLSCYSSQLDLLQTEFLMEISKVNSWSRVGGDSFDIYFTIPYSQVTYSDSWLDDRINLSTLSKI